MKKGKSKFYTILVINYIVFTCIIVISIIFILKGTASEIREIMGEPRINELVDYASVISRNKGNKLDKSHMKRLTGKDSFIQLLDENNKVIYESDPQKVNKNFTNGELECIHDYYDNPYIDIQKYKNDKGEKNISVFITYYDENDNIHNKVYVVDEKLNLIYTNSGDTRKSFTKNEFKYLTGSYIKGHDIRKYSFKDKDNEELTLLIYTPSFTNDYITKPFNPLEIVARVNSNLRRFYHFNKTIVEKEEETQLIVGDLTLDTQKLALFKKGEEVIVTPTEYKILALLMKTPGKVYTKLQMCEAINGDYIESDNNTIMVHVSRLREKVEDDSKNPEYIKTVRGIGYKIEKK